MRRASTATSHALTQRYRRAACGAVRVPLAWATLTPDTHMSIRGRGRARCGEGAGFPARLEHQLGVAARRERLRHGRVVHGGHQRVKARCAHRDQHGAAARGRSRGALGTRARRRAGHARRAGCRIGRSDAGRLQGRVTGRQPVLRAARAGRPRACAAGGRVPGPLPLGLLRAGGGCAAGRADECSGGRTQAGLAALRRSTSLLCP